MTTPRRSKRLWLIATGAIVLGAGSYLSQRPLSVPVVQTTTKPLMHTIVASGRVQTRESTNIASVISGAVTRVHVDYQDRVQAGQALLQLDDRELTAALAQARASLASTEARLQRLQKVTLPLAEQTLRQAIIQRDQAQRQFDNVSRLSKKGDASIDQRDSAGEMLALRNSQWQAAELQVRALRPGGEEQRQAQADLEQARASLALAEARLANTIIKAPASGLILSRLTEPGQVIQPGTPLFRYAPDTEPSIIVPIDEKNLSRLQAGQTARVSADAYPGQHFQARVSRLSPAVDASRGAVDIELAPDAPPDYLREDMTVSTEIIVAEKPSARVLPNPALQDADSVAPWVWRVDTRNNTVHRQPVTLGARGAGETEITSGLEDDTAVVANNHLPLQEGMRVRTELQP